jgi:hypothetical protein
MRPRPTTTAPAADADDLWSGRTQGSEGVPDVERDGRVRRREGQNASCGNNTADGASEVRDW